MTNFTDPNNSTSTTLPSVDGRPPHVLLHVSVDWFFVSHRLPLARALRAAGCRVSVAAEETDCRRRIEGEGFEFHALPYARGGREPVHEARSLAAVLSVYRGIRPDVVHHVSVKPIVYGSAAASVLGIRRVINAVSGLGYVFTDRAERSLRDRALAHAVRGAYALALSGRHRHVIFQNDDDRRTVAPRWLSPERVHVIPGAGVDLARFVERALPEGDPMVLLPARLLRDKGIIEFVEAARTLRRQGTIARFVLAGRIDPSNPAGVREDDVRAWVREGVVEWLGNVDPDEMPARYAAATLVVLPSYREGLPLVLAEAGAVGRAVVTTDVPGCRAIVRDGENGWVVPPRDSARLADAIRQALSSRVELQRRGRVGRMTVERVYSQAAILDATLAIYRTLLHAPVSSN